VIRRAVLAFLVLTAAWLGVGIALVPGMAYGYTVARLSIWWGLLVMMMAPAYYAIQELPAARVSRWLRRDLAVNLLLFLVVAFALVDGIQGSIVLGLRVSGAIAFLVAFVHPVLVDQPHANHHRRDPAGSPVPQYLPPACMWIDWLTAALLLGALLLL
jgi:accessory gene regulator protein AgrB